MELLSLFKMWNDCIYGIDNVKEGQIWWGTANEIDNFKERKTSTGTANEIDNLKEKKKELQRHRQLKCGKNREGTANERYHFKEQNQQRRKYIDIILWSTNIKHQIIFRNDLELYS